MDCVKTDWICDGTDDCDNGEDEQNCGETAAPTLTTILTSTVTTTTTTGMSVPSLSRLIP